MLIYLWNYPLPLWAYLLLWAGLTAGIAWFAWLGNNERKSRMEADALLRKAGETLEIGENEWKEMEHDYATLGLMVEDIHQNIADIQKELFGLDERLSKLEQRSTHIHIGISKLFQVCDTDDDDYTGPDDDGYADDDSDIVTLPQPLLGWLDYAEGLDAL